LHKISQERKSHLHDAGILKSHVIFVLFPLTKQ